MVLALALSLLVLFIGVWMAICRYCCCCCGRFGTCKCGAKFPTRKTLLFGFNRNELSDPSYSGSSSLVAQLLCCGIISFLGWVRRGRARAGRARRLCWWKDSGRKHRAHNTFTGCLGCAVALAGCGREPCAPTPPPDIHLSTDGPHCVSC